MVTTYRKGSDNSEELWLLRSYNHYRTSRAATAKSLAPSKRQASDIMSQGEKSRGTHRKINYGGAAPQEIWQVARAAAAPGGFFDPMTLIMSTGESEFQDGGMGPHNNPTREAILDIAEQSNGQSIENVVSIGTSRKSVSRRSNLKGLVKTMVDKSTNPQTVAETVETMLTSSETFNFHYWRFNAEPNSDHAIATEFDEWKPGSSRFGRVSGQKTIDYIRALFEKWANVERNRKALGECARELVNTRQARARQKAKWERFVTCNSFACRQEECRDNVFEDRDAFGDHLETQHRIVKDSAGYCLEMRECRRQWEYVPGS